MPDLSDVVHEPGGQVVFYSLIVQHVIYLQPQRDTLRDSNIHMLPVNHNLSVSSLTSAIRRMPPVL